MPRVNQACLDSPLPVDHWVGENELHEISEEMGSMRSEGRGIRAPYEIDGEGKTAPMRSVERGNKLQRSVGRKK